jgi:hypothetical protein
VYSTAFIGLTLVWGSFQGLTTIRELSYRWQVVRYPKTKDLYKTGRLCTEPGRFCLGIAGNKQRTNSEQTRSKPGGGMRPHCVRIASAWPAGNCHGQRVTKRGQNRDRIGTESNGLNVIVTLRVTLRAFSLLGGFLCCSLGELLGGFGQDCQRV